MSGNPADVLNTLEPAKTLGLVCGARRFANETTENVPLDINGFTSLMNSVAILRYPD